MLSFLIKKRERLYRNIPVIKFCYTREKAIEGGRRRDTRNTEKGRKKKSRTSKDVCARLRYK